MQSLIKTPLDLLAIVGIALALLIYTGAAKHAVQEMSAVTDCQDNLRQIAQSLVLYQSLNDGAFPRTRYTPDAPLTAYTGATSPDPFSDSGPSVNDVTAAAFLLARTMDVPADVLACPAARRHGLAQIDTFDRTTSKSRSNFSARLNYNYSLANMYPTTRATQAGYRLDNFKTHLPAWFAIAADTNPGGKEIATATTQLSRKGMRMTNSPNHQRDGQNVLFADGSVDFFQSPFVGPLFDSVYNSAGTFPDPASATDAVLLPIWTQGPDLIPHTTTMRRYILGAATVLTAAVLAWIVWHGTRRRV